MADKPLPLAWDVTRVPARYYTRSEWGEVKRLIREEKVDQYEALERVIAKRLPESVR